jgi:hypothetical protein
VNINIIVKLKINAHDGVCFLLLLLCLIFVVDDHGNGWIL